MVSLRWVTSVLLLAAMWGLVQGQQPELFPGQQGQPLENAVRAKFAPTTPLTDYLLARQKLFGPVDNQNGKVRLIYTNELIATQGIPNHSVVNTEHTWPQNHFKNAPKKSQIKCDLHHLFPSRSSVNSARSNHRFAEINDQQTQKWWISNSHQTVIPEPATARDGFSESTNNAFEPREDHKGDVARAMFYVYVIYGNQQLNLNWFKPQIDTLLTWHHADPATSEEVARSERIRQVQGNANPFVQDHTLIWRVLERPVPPAPLATGAPAKPALVGKPLIAKKTPPKPPVVPPGAANTVRIVTWNAHEIFSIPQDVVGRTADFQAFVAEIQPDVILLQEVTSHAQVEKLREVMGLTSYHFVCSNFEPEDDNRHGSFEVAILSKFPLDDVIEYDPSPDNDPNDPTEPEERQLQVPVVNGLPAQPSTSRGFLYARLDALKLTVRVTHLKSSRGAVGFPDRANAQKREAVVAAIAAGVADDVESLPEYTALVAGDLNVGETDKTKNGKNLVRDDFKLTGKPGEDGYDDTHALLSEGLIDNLRMRSLTKNLGLPTFNSTTFAHAGPIDCIYVSGPRQDQFTAAKRATITFGSDHWPVSTTYERP